MNPTRVWRDKAGGWHMTCEAPCCAHTTCDDHATAFEAALGHVAYWHGETRWTCRDCGESMSLIVEGCDERLAEWEADLLHGSQCTEKGREKRATGPRSAAQSPGEWLGHRDEARAQGGTW